LIFTFYSYKGGVGRSMALANVAETLHEKGLRVIMIDWDLEAPGLETFFCAPDSEKLLGELQAHPGLMDMLAAYKNAFPEYSVRRARAAAPIIPETSSPSQEVSEVDQDKIAELTREVLEKANVPAFRLNKIAAAQSDQVPPTLEAFIEGVYGAVAPSISSSDVGGTLAKSPFGPYLQCIHLPDNERNGLYLLSAGARSDQKFSSYATAVQGFNWSEFYASYGGLEYFTWFREQLQAIADVVLIDSRTGVTEMGGVCTRHIADAVVAFCAPNFQNVDGVVRVVSGLNKSQVKQARDNRAIEALVIPTRIDNSESGHLSDFSNNFADKVEHGGFIPDLLQDADRPFWNLQIPYIPRYNYREERVIGPGTGSPDPASQKLVDAYRKIAVHLAVLTPADSRTHGVFASEIQKAFPFLLKVAPQLAPVVSDSWVDRPKELDALKAELLRASSTEQLSRMAVCGWPGTGKSTLVARACRDPDIVNAYPGGVLWVGVDRPWTAEAARDWLRTNLGISNQGGERGILQGLSEKKYLIVADDVWSLDDVAELFKFGSRCTQVIITRDGAVAGKFGGSIINVGLLTAEQSLRILKADQVGLVKPDDPRFNIVQQLAALPLGAALIRSALDRRITQGATLPQAWEQLRDALGRHDVVAFDQLEGADRSTSIAQSLRATISRLKPNEEALLIRFAKNNDAPESATGAVRTSASEPEMQRLADFGLIDLQSGQCVVHPLVRAYLLVEGQLNERLESAARGSRISSSADKKDAENPAVERAKQIIRGESASLAEIRKLAESLKQERYFTYARQLFALAKNHPEARRLSEADWLKLVQRQALCTYRDPDLPAETRFALALELLDSADLAEKEPSSETLGLAGAIHKYQWKLGGRRRDLERSVNYYSRGASRDVIADLGYTGINAAFMLDMLAQQEMEDTPADAARHAAEARAIRERIISQLPPFAEKKSNAYVKREWWFLATLAETCFGLGRFSEARYWLREGLALNPPQWELESTTRQLAALAVAQKLDLSDGSEAQRTLCVIFGDATHAVRGATIGKVGLALSGGGFRASLFHIGVLARMAELDMLRYVEVLSCVSGGSIVGAHYYLEVRRLLQEKSDSEITRDDYIEIVRHLERDFLQATQENLRLRLFAGWWANLRSLLQPGYTRTTYLGWLFEKHIYSRVKDGYSHGRRWLNELQIKPKGVFSSFNPKVDNWSRSAKAPILLLNATTLNTGHNWQFAVSWMGEPPLGASSPIDRNDILRRMYYWEAPLAHRRVALGQAVAASACVPSLFDPVEFRGLYPERSVRLVDGGTHDNQGIVGLLEQECTVMLVSDASGQSSSESHPSEEILSVGFRTSNILMARVREAEYRELDLLRRSSALNGLVFLHLKKDLDAGQIDWVDCQDPSQDETPGRNVPLTSYGIPRTVQARLAAIRTDLDSFTDNEAYALMLSGYRMMTTETQNSLFHLPLTDKGTVKWDFLAVEDVVLRAPGREAEHVDLLRQLTASASLLFKVWQLSPYLKYLVTFAVLALVGMIVVDETRYAIGELCEIPSVKACSALAGVLGSYAKDTSAAAGVSWLSAGLQGLRWTVSALLGIGAVSLGLWVLHRVFRTRKSLTVIATGLVMVTVGWFFALIHLFPLNWLYLRYGRVQVPPRS
jgi:predicted acylesterase/phospholipase RssA